MELCKVSAFSDKDLWIACHRNISMVINIRLRYKRTVKLTNVFRIVQLDYSIKKFESDYQLFHRKATHISNEGE